MGRANDVGQAKQRIGGRRLIGEHVEPAAADLTRLTRLPVAVLAGGNTAWVAEGQPVETGDAGLASPRIDRYRRPYEGTDAPREAMQAYLDGEYGLVEQLGRDGTHGFQVLAAA